LLGHTGLESGFRYRLQTLRDNLRLFNPELMARINAEVVRAGHLALGLNAQAPLHSRCDSIVVENAGAFSDRSQSVSRCHPQTDPRLRPME